MKPALIFAAWPYVSLSGLCLGIVLRFFLGERHMPSLKAKLLESWEAFGGSRSWLISMTLLLLGHFAGVAFPQQILLWDRSAIGLYALESLAFAIGALTLAGWAVLVWRHVKRSHGSLAAEVADTIFFAFTLTALFSGLLIATLYRWGSFWGVITLRPYLVSVLQGAPAAGFVTQMPFLVRLHVFSSFAAVALVPFTRLAPVLVLALHRGVDLLSKPISAIAHAAEGWLPRHSVAEWIWPPED
jgi:nitrate reductase gamma subunit